MGTRCVTIFKDEDDKVICSIWNKYDGNPERFGVDKLAKFLSSRTLAVRWEAQDRTVFGGIGDAAASFISYLKCFGHPYYPSGPMQGLPDMKQPQQWRDPEIGHISLLPVTLNLTDIRCDYVYVVRQAPTAETNVPTEQEGEFPWNLPDAHTTYGFMIETWEHPKKLLFKCSPEYYEAALANEMM